MTNNPYISVMIPTKNRAISLKKTLDSLKEQKFKDFEVVIVDGGSTDNTRGLVEEYQHSFPVVFTSQSGGLIPQENKGWRLAKGHIVIRTDDDVIMTDTWLQAIAETFKSDEGVCGVTGPTIIPEKYKEYRDLFHFQKKLNSNNPLWKLIGKIYFDFFLEGEPYTITKWFRSGAFSLGSNFKESMDLTAPIEVDHHEACNMAMRRDLLKKVGGFDETYAEIGEYNEPDVSFKMRRLGYKIIFHPGAAVFHCPSKEGFFKDRPNSYSRMMNFLKFYFRHIKPNTFDKFVRFSLYVAFLNTFFTYKFITTFQMNQLGSIPATVIGITKFGLRRSSWERGYDFRVK